MLKIPNDTIVQILWKQLQGGMTTKDEKKILDEWRSGSEHNQKLFDEISGQEQWKNDLILSLDRDEDAIWNRILPRIQKENQVTEIVKIRKPWYNYAVAAALIGITLTGGYFLLNNYQEQEISKTTTVVQKESMVSEELRAVLKLSDGSSIYLNDAKNGELAREGNSKIKKLKDGELVYDAANKNIAANQLPLTFNTLSTPRGKRYSLILQDGSKIWLNAASTLRFPSSFNGGERVVELTGEAYFEIAPSKLSGPDGQNHRSPFFVKANGSTVEVLGTDFNVMAYPDEPVTKTTLIDGAVKVKKGDDVCLLKPGQQSQIPNEARPLKSGSQIRVVNEGTHNTGSWKNGYLSFASADIPSVMRELSRSFKVGVSYKGQSGGTFSGKISLNTSISEIVTALSISGINATLINGVITVQP